MPTVKATCEKINCSLDPNHDGWHVKKAARGKIVISWLDGEWKTPDGQTGTYSYQEPMPSVPLADGSDPVVDGRAW